MGRDAGPKCKKCRREGTKLFLKGERCYTPSCPLSKRSAPPGERPKKHRPRRSQYLLHLREKHAVYRAGFASSRDQARQLITHGHFQLNDRPVNIPSILLREGDRVGVKEGRRPRVKSIIEANKDREVPNWLEKQLDTMSFQAIAAPNLEETGYSIAANLIVEFYSR